MGALIRPVKGTRDWYPEQMMLRNWIYGTVRMVAERYGYQEYDVPALEMLELYAAKSGDELVKEQSFAFADRSGETLVLRPEITPSLARLVAQRQQELPLPIRWWMFGPCWRYEQPSRKQGRSREFYQWNLDLIVAESVYADVEVLRIVTEVFRMFGLTPEQVVIRLSHRGMLANALQRLGLAPEQRMGAYHLIDKREKLAPAAWWACGRETVGLSDTQLAALEALLEDRELWRTCPELVALFETAAALGADAFLEFDPTIVRGLDYYTGLVFEAWDRRGEFRAILGGGRYGNLVADVGGAPLGGIGVGMGDVVMGLLLERERLLPPFPPTPAWGLVTVFSAELQQASAVLAARLRVAGLSIAEYPEPARLGKQLKYAAATGIPYALLLGPDEVAQGMVTLRNMADGTQTQMTQEELLLSLSAGEWPKGE